MAEEKKETARGERGERSKRLYDHDSSKKARGEPEKEEGAARRGGEADPKAADGKHVATTEVLGRHAEERESLRAAHEAERRDEHGRQRDEHRRMNARHEEEHKAVTDHASLVAVHRKHEHEKHALRGEHEKRHKDMAERHDHERHTLNMKHEAEVLGATQQMDQAGQEGGEAGLAAAA